MRIKKIHIENFKRFGDIELELSPLNCIVGPNNCGKSTLLQGLALFDFVLHHTLSQKNGPNSPWELKNRSIAPEDFFAVPVATPIDLWTNKIARKKNKMVAIKISVTFENRTQVETSVTLTYNRFLIRTRVDKENQELLQQLRRCKISHLPIFSSFLTREERRTPAVIADALARGHVSSVMRNLLVTLKEQNKVSELVEILQRAFPAIHNLEVIFDEDVNRFVDVSYREEGQDKNFDLFMSGSGFQQFVYLFGLILLRNPDVILLDEPDVHLHGALQGALLGEIDRLVQSGKQILVATHSRDLIDRVAPKNILALHDGQAQRLQVRFDVYDTLKQLGSFDQVEMAKLQTFKRLLVVEDKSDWNLLQIFCSTILGEKTWRQIEQRLALWFTKGNPSKIDLPKLRNQLSETLCFTGEPLKMFAIGDLDYCPKRIQLMEKKSDQNVTLYLWESNEIENYLLNEEAIGRMIEEKGELLRYDLLNNLKQEFAFFIEEHKDEVEIMCTTATKYHERKINDSKEDDSVFQRAAKKFMATHWNTKKLAFTDAKKVLACVKQWSQKNTGEQFSDLALAKKMEKHELSDDLIYVAKQLCAFASIREE